MKLIYLARTLLRNNGWFAAVFQSVLVFASIVFAWFLRFDFTLPQRRLLLEGAAALIIIRMTAIALFGLLHGWWRYTGLSDTLDVLKAVASGTVAFILVWRYMLGITGFPRSIFVLESVLTTGLLIGVRVLSRVLAESVRQDIAASKKVLLIGAGTGAQTVVRELRRARHEFAPVGYVDDDPTKLGLKIEEIPVLGSVSELPVLVQSYPVDEVLIAVPSATSQQMQRFVGICERSNVKFRTVPTLRDILAGRVGISDFREVDVDDLLGRDPVQIDLDSVRWTIEGRSVLVTGAAGSIGSELCRQLLEHRPSTLVCVDQDETGMFYLSRELSKTCCKGTVLRCHVADIGDRREMRHILRATRPEAIFHAAAYKHVPLMEVNVYGAVQNNVVGLKNLLAAANETGCKTFIFISSDKAVNPSSVMGATKRIGELIIGNQPTNGMRCLSVRFGNVLGSKGSIIPVLQQQLRRNQPLTLTHPEMKRFFMTIREAVSLVLQASVVGDRGDTLVLDMGEPVLIVELARTLIRLSGRNEDDVKVLFTGLREGEKMSEQLFYLHEQVGDTSFSKIKRARGRTQDWSTIEPKLEELENALVANNPEILRMRIKNIVPEYCGPPGVDTQSPEVKNLWPAIATGQHASA